VHLTFSPVLANNSYTLTVNGVEDLSANPTVGESAPFTVGAVPVNPGDVIITEVMYNDAMAGTDIEWVELYNTTASAIDISGWVLSDAPAYPPVNEGVVAIPAATSLNAGAYMVIGWNADILLEIPTAVVGTTVYGTLALGNTGDNLTLYTAQTGGTLIYGSLSHNFDNLTTTPGYSIEVCLEDFGQDWATINWYQSDAVYATTGRFLNCTPGTAPHTCEVDVTPPVLTGATLASLTAVDAHFDEAVDVTTAQTITNYSIDNGFGNPTSATLLTGNQTVRLQYGATFTPNTYTLTVNNVRDLSNNVILPGSTTQFVVNNLQNIVITEIMPNPNFELTADSLGEWIEIYNGEASAVDLTGWIISDNQGSDTIESGSIAAGDYFVFCSNGNTATNGGVPTDYAYHFATSGGGWGLALSNTGETITLRNASSEIVTSVTYTGYPFNAGISCQLRNVTDDPTVVGNWCAAGATWAGATNGDFGTPGAATVCAGPSVPTDATICEIRTQDASGISLLINTHVRTTGVVTHVDACRFNVFVEDNGCAVLIYGNPTVNNMIGHTRPPMVGDQIQVEGTLVRYNGLSEFSGTAMIPAVITYLSASVATTDECIISAADIDIHLDNCTIDACESRHVTLENVTFADGNGTNTFGTVSANYSVVSADLADTAVFRLSNCDLALVGTLIPSERVNIHGILGQFDNTSPYCGGYQIQTGRNATFSATEIPCTVPVSVTNYFNSVTGYVDVIWNPGLGQLCTCYKIYYATIADAEFPAEYTFLDCVCGVTEFQDIDPLAPMRVYVVVATESCP
jgi:hypothetical protein